MRTWEKIALPSFAAAASDKKNNNNMANACLLKPGSLKCKMGSPSG